VGRTKLHIEFLWGKFVESGHLEDREHGGRVDRTGSGSFPVAGLSVVEPPDYSTRQLIKLHVLDN
jgi:hypothetical protein